MNLFIKIKKIIACAILACVLVTSIPVQIFAQTSTTPKYNDLVDVKDGSFAVKQSSWQNYLKAGYNAVGGNVPLVGFLLPTAAYDYEIQKNPNTRGGGGILVSEEYYGALINASPNKLINPRTDGDAFERENLYMHTDGETTVVYYRPNGGDEKSKNDNTVIIAVASKGEIGFPKGGFAARGEQEKALLDALDVKNGKAPGTTYQTLADVVDLKDLQQKQVEAEAQIAEINKKLEDDLKSDTLTTAQRQKLEEERDQLIADNNARKNRIENGVEATTGGEMTTSCPSGILSALNILDPSCLVSIMAIIASTILKLSAFILYWTGNLFDYSIEIAVNSAEFLKKLQVIEPTWAFVRDALNMTFIFILLFVAVKILLGKDNYTAKYSIARLVLVAILMNFSLFAAKVMIDASNIVSLNIYEGIKSKQPGQKRGNVSERIMTTLGLSGVYNFGEIFDKRAIPGCGGAPGTILTVGVFGSILLTITSLTFLLAAVLFFLRMLNILVLFVTSPIFVWGFVMENGYFKQKTAWWWSGMKHAIQFPITYMLMLYVALAMFAQLNSAQQASGNRISLIKLICETSKNADASVLDKLPLILNFLIVIMSLIGIIMYASKKSGDGGMLTGKLSTQFSNKINNLQRKFTTDAAQGVYNKSRDAVIGTGNLAAAGVGKVKDASLTLAKDVGRVGLNKASNTVADKLAKAATGQGVIGSKLANMPRAQAFLAGQSNKFKDRAIFGETEKAAVERRTKGVKERAEVLAKIQAEEFKVMSEKEWKKDNPNGNSLQYEEYLKGKVALIEKSQLGGLQNTAVKNDANGQPITTETFIRTDIYEDVKDKNGNVVGKKLNEEKLYKNIQEARKQHNEKGNLLKADKEKRFGITTTERAKVRLKAEDEALKKRHSDAKTKQGKAEQVKRKNAELEKLRKTIADEIPSDITSLDPNMNATDKNKYHKDVRSYLQEKKDIIEKRDAAIRRAGPSVDVNKITQDAQVALDALDTTYEEKISAAKTKIEDRIEKLITDIDKLEEEKEKK